MKKLKSFIAFVLMFAMLFSLNVMFDGLASPDGGLNGASGKWSDFNHSVYDTEVDATQVYGNIYTWPSSGTVLVTESATSPSFTIAEFNGVKITAGIVVDFYKYNRSADTYTLLGHFDTTDGNPVTIGSDNSGNSTADTPSVASVADKPSISSNSGNLGKVRKTFMPGTPSASYSKSYDDVTPDLWCYDAIMTLTDGGILSGYGDGKFGPNDTLTRAQLNYIRSRLLKGNASTASVNDTTINGYKPRQDHAIATRAFTAIALTGYMPEWRKVSLTKYERSLIADSAGLSSDDRYKTMMYESVYDTWRPSLNKDVKYRSSIDQFPDAAEIHKWIDENAELMRDVLILNGDTHDQLVKDCEKYFLRAYNLGMFNGVDSQGTFNPYGSITRGQLCKALYNVGWTYGACLDYNS